MVEEVNRLNGVVTQFLDYSRPLKPSLAPTSVNEVLEKTFKLLQAQAPEDVAVELELAEWLPRVQADAEQLKQVFLNLALNAFQAMPGGGRLHVSHPGRARRARLLARGVAARGRRRDPLPRHRPGHPRGGAREHLRPLLHDEGEGDRPRPRHLPAHREGAPGIDRRPLPARRGGGVPRSRCRACARSGRRRPRGRRSATTRRRARASAGARGPRRGCGGAASGRSSRPEMRAAHPPRSC